MSSNLDRDINKANNAFFKNRAREKAFKKYCKSPSDVAIQCVKIKHIAFSTYSTLIDNFYIDCECINKEKFFFG